MEEKKRELFKGVREAATAPFTPQPIEGHTYVIGVDWGLDHDDQTVICVIDRNTMQMADITYRDQSGWHGKRDAVKYMCEKWQPTAVLANSNSVHAVNIENLQAEGLPVHPFALTAMMRSLILIELAMAIHKKEVTFQNSQPLIDQLVKAQVATKWTGSVVHDYPKVLLPEGMSDTALIAFALTLWAARHMREEALIRFV